MNIDDLFEGDSRGALPQMPPVDYTEAIMRVCETYRLATGHKLLSITLPSGDFDAWMNQTKTIRDREKPWPTEFACTFVGYEPEPLKQFLVTSPSVPERTFVVYAATFSDATDKFLRAFPHAKSGIVRTRADVDT